MMMISSASVGRVVDLADRPVAAVLDSAVRGQVDALLPEFLQSQRWFAGKGAALESARIADAVPIAAASGDGIAGHLAMIDVRYADGTPAERYAAALVARPEGGAPLAEGSSVLGRVQAADGTFLLADAPADDALVGGLVHAMRGDARTVGDGALLVGQGGGAYDDAVRGLGSVHAEPLSLHTSNTSVRVHGEDGSTQALKLVRRHDATLDPSTPTRALDVWKGAYLTDEAHYANTPAVLGSLDHVGPEGLPRTVAVLSEFVPNDGDGWAHALEAAQATAAAARGGDAAAVRASIDGYATAARNHGTRLGGLHAAFAGGGAGSEFRGVAMGTDAVEARLARVQQDAARTIEQLRRAGRADAADAIERGLPARLDEVRAANAQLVPVDAIHTHGDFHLGQLLKTGDDVQVIDLEGAPALPLAERWQRTSALGDVARQRSSYEYAASQVLHELAGSDAATAARVEPALREWASTARDAFTDGWLDSTAGQRFRHARSEFGPELREAEIANALYETSYELGSRPDWVDIPLGRLQRLVAGDPG